MRPEFDDAWKARALSGDRAALAHLADEAIGPLWAFCFYRVGKDRHRCEEVVQETLLRAVRKLAAYEPARAGNHVFPWLSGLARNEIRRVHRGNSRTRSLDSLWERMDRELMDVYAKLESHPLDDDVLVREETRDMVNATMSQLPPHYRAALEAKYVDDASTRDLAGRLDLTEKAAESLLGRARQAFRATFTALTKNLGTEPAL